MGTNIDEPSCSKDYKSTLSDSQILKQLKLLLKPLDEVLMCHICFEFYDTCMITKCCHGYCSLCIRKYMSFKAQCPECFKEAVEPELRSNRQIDQVLVVYKKIRNFLTSLGVYESPKSTENSPIIKKRSSFSETEYSDDELNTSNNELPSSSGTLDCIQITNCRSVESSNDSFSNASPKHGQKVPCPVCSSMVFEHLINVHLDKCLKEDVHAIGEKRRPLPKLVYHLMSEKDIKKRLKEYGLNTTGNKQNLIKRHKNFVVSYNAECDTLNPRPVSELVNQLEAEEIEMKNSQHGKLFQSNKKSDPESIIEEHEEYLRHNKQHFDNLVNDIKNREHVKMEIQDTFDAAPPVTQICESSMDSDVSISLLTPFVVIDTPQDQNNDDLPNTQEASNENIVQPASNMVEVAKDMTTPAKPESAIQRETRYSKRLKALKRKISSMPD